MPNCDLNYPRVFSFVGLGLGLIVILVIAIILGLCYRKRLQSDQSFPYTLLENPVELLDELASESDSRMELQEIVSTDDMLDLSFIKQSAAIPESSSASNPSSLSVHDALEEALGHEVWWNSLPFVKLREAVMTYSVSNRMTAALRTYDTLSLSAALSLVYFTSDIRKYGGLKTENIYFMMNQVMQERDAEAIARWSRFIALLFSARNALPKFRGTVYRGIDKPIAQNYAEGQEVTWASFSSTTTDENVIKNFSEKHHGTWMIINGVQNGVQIPFSMFPNEREVLLYPNTVLAVDHV